MTEIPKAPVVRICKDAGVERISPEAQTALTEAVEEYIKKLSEACNEMANHAGRKTVQEGDVELALKYI